MRGKFWQSRLLQGQELVIALIGVALAIFFGVYSSAFSSVSNLSTLSSYVAPIMIVGIAEVFVLTLGEIDLSVGEVYVLSPFLVVYLKDAGLGVVAGTIVTLLICAAIGCINGLITVHLGVPSFITTLGTVFALQGIVLLSSNGIQINPAGAGTIANVLGGWTYSSILWALAIAVLGYVIFRRTTFGLHITAVGGNQTASGESGIKVGAVKVWCFVLCSLLGGFVGLLDGYRIGSLNPGTDGLVLMFYGVAAAVIGGTALTGGRGTMIGAAIGAIVLGVLEDGFNIIGINAFAYQLVLGLAILGAMVLNVQLELVRSGKGGGVYGSFARLVLRSRRAGRRPQEQGSS
ncbi:ABC transporter permease [Leekyejoonella antrihumi]|uniref:Autoinducer 2 import system permease protein LsrD n=1 Tax=Leekyejoonella antrihumi TaxID=1660198 RepID=A0A563E6M1_9MICO|nr:ABC transporter permease [Leekyejoonella antrihumi]TWP38208.1 ABC transporter permease [Leekyejoonella antrihumi]